MAFGSHLTLYVRSVTHLLFLGHKMGRLRILLRYKLIIAPMLDVETTDNNGHGHTVNKTKTE